MNISDLLHNTRELLDRMAHTHRMPALCWSGGKDSMVLLDITRRMGINWPVLHFDWPWQPHRRAFITRIIREWSLVVHRPPVHKITLQQANGILEPVRQYLMAEGKWLSVPTNVQPLDAKITWNSRAVCGIHDLMALPGGVSVWPWDVLIVGHKASDVDPLLGPVPVQVDYKRGWGEPSMAFPLREWTDADIWEYHVAYDVPYQTDRYNPDKRTENPDVLYNPDYLEVCLKCMDRQGPALVDCPKFECKVANVGASMPYAEPCRHPYFTPPETKEIPACPTTHP